MSCSSVSPTPTPPSDSSTVHVKLWRCARAHTQTHTHAQTRSYTDMHANTLARTRFHARTQTPAPIKLCGSYAQHMMCHDTRNVLCARRNMRCYKTSIPVEISYHALSSVRVVMAWLAAEGRRSQVAILFLSTKRCKAVPLWCGLKIGPLTVVLCQSYQETLHY